MENLASFESLEGLPCSIAADDKITSVREFATEKRYNLPNHVTIIRDGEHFTVKGTHAEVMAKLDAARDKADNRLVLLDETANLCDRLEKIITTEIATERNSRTMDQVRTVRAAIAKAT